MLAKADQIGKIRQLYMEGRPVPYLAFMNVFNDLLADAAKVEPLPPGGKLSDSFWAACMACNVGVIDTEGRGEERIHEFRTKIYPYWKSEMSPKEFARFADAYEGRLRGAATAEDEAAAGTGIKVTPKTSALLKRLKLIESDESGQISIPVTPRAAPEESGNGAPAVEAEPAPFPNVDEVIRAIEEGHLKVEFAPLAVKKELARYFLGRVLVAIRCAWGKQEASKNHVVLTARLGYSNVRGSKGHLDSIASEMGYVKRGERAYTRWDDDFGYTMKIGPSLTNMACAAPPAGALETAPVRIQKLHGDLTKLVKLMRSIGRKA